MTTGLNKIEHIIKSNLLSYGRSKHGSTVPYCRIPKQGVKNHYKHQFKLKQYYECIEEKQASLWQRITLMTIVSSSSTLMINAL